MLPYIRFHDLRHIQASLMLQQGVHPKIVSERLGHSTIGITMDTYTHVLPNIQKEAAHQFEQLIKKETIKTDVTKM
jgi:integrase